MKMALMRWGWSRACWRLGRLVQRLSVGRWVPVRGKREMKLSSVEIFSKVTRMLLSVSSRERRGEGARFGGGPGAGGGRGGELWGGGRQGGGRGGVGGRGPWGKRFRCVYRATGFRPVRR